MAPNRSNPAQTKKTYRHSDCDFYNEAKVDLILLIEFPIRGLSIFSIKNITSIYYIYIYILKVDTRDNVVLCLYMLLC